MASWNQAKKRWQASLGTGKERIWFYDKRPDEGEEATEKAKRAFVEGPKPLRPGSTGEFVENIWFPHINSEEDDEISMETARGYESAWRLDIEPEFGTMLMKEIDALKLQGFVNTLKRKYPNRKTVKNKYGVLQSILAMAYRLGVINTNFKDKVLLPRVVKKKVRKNLDFNLVGKILASVEGTIYEVPAWSSLMFALRHGELFGMRPCDFERREDLNPPRYNVSLTESRQRKQTRKKLKNKEEGEARVFGIPIEWGERILACRSPMQPDTAPIFRNSKDKPMLSNTYSNMVHKYMRDAGIEGVTTQEFRNIAISNFRRLGIHEFTSRDIAGHADEEMTYNYTDQDTSMSLDVFSRLKSTYDSQQGTE